MPTVRFRFAAGTPPAPAVLLNLSHPVDLTVRAPDQAALVDTGADQTVLPARLIAELRLVGRDAVEVRGYDGTARTLPTYLVRLQVRDLTPIDVEVIGSSDVPNVILGRDVLNRYTITLDGPAGRITVSDDPTP
jgi:predicted aspartyl protease